MRKKAIGIISCNYTRDSLQGLAQNRPISAVPFGGRYRLLDFALSNMVNCGVRTVGIVTPQKYRAILDHMGAGKPWFLDRKAGGMFFLPGATAGIHARTHKFSIRDMINNLEYFTRDDADYVIISGSSTVFNVDYSPILEYHEKNQADVTMVYKEMFLEAHEEQGYCLQLDENNQVQDIDRVQGKEGQRVTYFANIMIVHRELLIDMIHACQDSDDMDLTDVIHANLKYMKAQAYPITSYFGRVFSVDTYYRRSMDLLKPSIRSELFMGPRDIHTKIKDNPPTKYQGDGLIQDALVSSGCHIQGNVTSSILFRGVVVEPGATIKNSIIMQKCIIRKGAVLENVILDKLVEVHPQTVIQGKEDNPIILRKNAVV